MSLLITSPRLGRWPEVVMNTFIGYIRVSIGLLRKHIYFGKTTCQNVVNIVVTFPKLQIDVEHEKPFQA